MLDKIEYLNFRNINHQKIKLSKGINIFVGENAVGKTNLLEGIYYLLVTSTYQKAKEESLINDEKDFLKVQGRIKTDTTIKDVMITFDKKGKKKKVTTNGNLHSTLYDYIGVLPVILSSPRDLHLIGDSPNSRRRLLDLEISQLENLYMQNANAYSKLLKLRNDSLKNINLDINIRNKYMLPVNKKLSEKASNVYNARRRFIKEINKFITQVYLEISGFDGLTVKYVNNMGCENDDLFDVNKKLFLLYNKTIEKDLYYGSTQIGPHRDDIIFEIDGKDLNDYGSEGQKKLAMIAFKLAEIKVFEDAKDIKPILLLDDIFGQIDDKRKNKLMNYLDDDLQVIITTNDIKSIKKEIKNKAKIFKIEKNKITEVKNGKSNE